MYQIYQRLDVDFRRTLKRVGLVAGSIDFFVAVDFHRGETMQDESKRFKMKLIMFKFEIGND